MEKQNVSQQKDNLVEINTKTNTGFSETEETFRKTKIDEIWTIIWEKEKGYSGGIANRQLTKWYKTEKEIKDYLKGSKNGKVDWNLIGLVTLTLWDIQKEKEELENKINNRKNG